jgi:endonuclease III related protein
MLLSSFGKQGWWPLIEYKGTNPTKTGSINGYHPGKYDLPVVESQKFEICIGAILAQNTSWLNAEKAIVNLKKNKLLDAKCILNTNIKSLASAIRPAGYYNQKAKKLKIFSKFFIELNGKVPSRMELLELWGIGKETADSILLYSYKQPVFVVDSYTKRIFERLGYREAEYDELQQLIENNLPKDYKIYNEFHALLVELAKRHCRTKPVCIGCVMEKKCKKLTI